MSDPASATPPVRLETHDGGVAVVTIDNGKVNALSIGVLGLLHQTMQDLRRDLPGVVVITGGPRLFAAGAEISEFGGPTDAARVGGAFREALDTVASFPRVTIASVSGYALGGGCELALACDFRIASERAKFGQPEILLGIVPGGGGTQRLPRLVGPARAKDMILTGRQVGAAEALAIGLVDEVVAPDALDDRVMERARELARGPLAAQAFAKRAIDEGLDGTLAEGIELEHELFVEVFETDDATIGVRNFLANGSGPVEWTGK
jgi:enoyl-CoA hydratase/carnithine racemase